MKAIVYEKYGPPEVLQLQEVPRPVPQLDEILIKMFATTVRTGDWRVCKPDPAADRPLNSLSAPNGALGALTLLRDKGRIQERQKMMIYGASGSVGSFALQIANYFGAEVTAVCSTANLDWVQALGADQVPEAHRHVEKRHKWGNVIIKVVSSAV